jgi:hypothetical protein
LEAIPIYWISLAWVLKCVMEVIRRLLYQFIWVGDQKKKGIVYALWKKLVVPKINGGWGLKNPFLFSKVLVAKTMWMLIK